MNSQAGKGNQSTAVHTTCPVDCLNVSRIFDLKICGDLVGLVGWWALPCRMATFGGVGHLTDIDYNHLCNWISVAHLEGHLPT